VEGRQAVDAAMLRPARERRGKASHRGALLLDKGPSCLLVYWGLWDRLEGERRILGRGSECLKEEKEEEGNEDGELQYRREETCRKSTNEQIKELYTSEGPTVSIRATPERRVVSWGSSRRFDDGRER